VLCADSELARAPWGPWDEAIPDPQPTEQSLFDPPPAGRAGDAGSSPDGHATGLDVVAELGRQLAAVDGSVAAGRLRLLLAAESTGTLVAAEMHADGLP